MELHDELCIINQCNEIGCYRHECECLLIEKVEDRTRAHIKREREQMEEQTKLYALATLTREGDTVSVKIDDGDRIFGTVTGRVVRTGPKRTGVAVAGVTVLDPFSKRVSDNIKDIKIVELVNPSGTATY
jgi:hypothetical protein